MVIASTSSGPILSAAAAVGALAFWPYRAYTGLVRWTAVACYAWWLYGTDHTRHWMASGVTWSPDHTDITNHYLQMGVLGGLPLMILFIVIVVKGFTLVGRGLEKSSVNLQFAIWALGASWCAHAVNAI